MPSAAVRSKTRSVRIPKWLRAPKWLREAFADAPDILQHTVGLTLAVVSLWLIHVVYAELPGNGQSKFFSVIPVQWAFDAAELAVLGTFVVKVVRRMWKS